MKGLIGFLVGKMYLISKLVIYQDLNEDLQILDNKFLISLNIDMSNLILEQIGEIDLIFIPNPLV